MTTKESAELAGLTIFNCVVGLERSITRHAGCSALIVAVGQLERRLRLVDSERVEALLAAIDERYTPEELGEILFINNEDLFDKFLDLILERDWDELL